VKGHPSLDFQVIINPSSGPGQSGSQPEPQYTLCIEQLKNAGSNVNLIGYVSTNYGDRDQAEISADIQTYAGWDDAYKLNGIFFDEEANTADKVELYEGYASEARDAFPDGTVSI
jgi:hypothetical protein